MALGFSYEDAIGDTPMAVKAEPIGLRNNNPGNLRASPTSFQQFETPEAGLTAAAKNLQAYSTKHGLNTIRGIIGRWAPSSENNTPAYVDAVVKQTGHGADDPLDMKDADTLTGLLDAITTHENGRNPYGRDKIGEVVNGVLGIGMAHAAGNSPAPSQGFSYENAGGFSYEDANGAAAQQKPGFIDRVGADLSKRGAMAGDIMKADMNNQQTGVESGLQLAGKVVAGGVGDVIGEGLKSVGGAIASVTPDFIKQPISDASKAILNSDVGKAGLAAIKQGADAYHSFAEANPRAARDIESVVDIAALLPVGKVPEAAGTIVKGATTAAKAGDEFVGQGLKKAAQAVGDVAGKVGLVDKSPYKTLPKDERYLADTIEGQGIDPGQTAAKMQQARQKGYTLPMADAAESPALRGLGSDVAKTTAGSRAAQAAYDNAAGKETSDILQKITEKTAGRAGTVDEFSKAFQEGSQQIIDNAVKARSGNAEKVFNKLVQKGTNININGIMKDPDIAQQIVDSIARVKETYPSLSKAGYNDIRILHKVQQDLNSFYKEGSQLGKPARNKAFNALVGQMEAQVPDYKVARNAYKSASEHIDDLKEGPIGLISDLGKQNFDDAGKKILGMPASSVAELRKQFMTLKRGKSGMTGAETFDGMMASAISKMVGTRTAGTEGAVASKLLTPENRSVINAGLNPTKAKQLTGFLETLDSAFDAQKSLDSYTEKSAPVPPSKHRLAGAVDLVKAVLPGGGSLKSYIADAAKENLLNKPANVENLGKYLFTQDGEQFLRKLASLKNPQQKQAATAGLTYKLAGKRLPPELIKAVRDTGVAALLLNRNNYQGENNAVP